MERKTKNSDFLRDWLNVIVRLYDLHGWRIMDGRDENGIVTRYIMFPVEYNDVMFTKDGRPYFSFTAIPIQRLGRNRYGFTYFLTPHFRRGQREELAARGYIPKGSHGNFFGGIRPFGNAKLPMSLGLQHKKDKIEQLKHKQ